MTKVGADDFITAGATVSSFEALPREELAPLIHLGDIERTQYVGHVVRTDLIVAGVGETFHVPQAWEVECDADDCAAGAVKLSAETTTFLTMCRMSTSQLVGRMRQAAGCSHRSRVRVTGWATITELLALPAASADGAARDYREKVIAFVGTMTNSNIRYRATGLVIAEPKQQRASLLATSLDRLQSAAEGFRMTPDVARALTVFQVPAEAGLDETDTHAQRIAATVTETVTKVYGAHRVTVLLAELATFHSVREIPWRGERIKGVVDFLAIGDTGQGKTTQLRRLIAALGLGHFASGSTSSRTGVLYTLDSKVNDKRVLRWGAFPLAHGELLAVDEAHNIPREQWQEFTTARSEGVLRVDRAIRAEHPSRARFICFANPARPSMAEFQYGIMAVHPSHGFLSAQDLRRFDLVACVTEGDQTADDIRAGVNVADVLPIPPSLLRASVLWAWTRTADHVDYAPQTEPAILALAGALQETFGTPEIPLLITDTTEKVARLAVAFATMLHSTDSTHERVVVTPVHVALVGRLMAACYTHDNCAFDQYAAVLRRRTGLTEAEYKELEVDLLTPGSNREDVTATETLLELFTTEDDIPRADLEAATGLGRDALNGRLGKLRRHRLIQSGRGGYRKTARFVAFLRRWALIRLTRPNPYGPSSGGGVSR